jgi:hypothetical protein
MREMIKDYKCEVICIISLLAICTIRLIFRNNFQDWFWYVLLVLILLFVFPPRFLKVLSKFVKEDLDLRHPLGIHANKWDAAIRKPERGGEVLGFLERTVFYFAFFRFPEFIGVWLAFKVASKWENWQNVVRVPHEVEGTEPVDYLRARVNWGSNVLQSFLRGTLLNIIFAFLAYLVTIGVLQ